MAVGHITFDRNTSAGGFFGNALAHFEAGLEQLKDVRDAMAQMIDGNGSEDEHYTYAVSRYGFPNAAAARAAYLELSAMLGKLDTNAPVENVAAAINQALAKFRN